MVNDYKFWLEENDKLIKDLRKGNSVVIDRFEDIFLVLNFLSKSFEDLDADESLIYDYGYAYLYDRFSYIKNFLENDFKNNLAIFFKYDIAINYYIYIEDLLDVLAEKEVDMSIYKERLDNISTEIREAIEKRADIGSEDIARYNIKIDASLPSNMELLSVPEIFSRILDELILEENKAGRKFRA